MESLTATLIILSAIGTLILLTCLTFVALNLLVFKTPKPLTDTVAPDDLPKLSILVPARNEERSIGACLQSLLDQNYPDVEIILLDDDSTDRTAEIARGLGFSDSGPRRIINGQKLPDGWVGKNWACHQLSQAASGDWLLFTDADTVHQPGGLISCVNYARSQRAALCSAWPKQITISLGEKLVIPQIHLLILGFLPQFMLRIFQSLPRFARLVPSGWLRSLGAANGQYVLFQRTAYDRIGGHAGVKNHLVEDIALGRAVASHTAKGLRLVNCDGSKIVTCRMYHSTAEVWEGFTKNLRQAFEGNVGVFLFSIVVQAIGFLLPFLLVFCGGIISLLAAIQIALIYLIRTTLGLRFHAPWLSVLLHPVGHGFALLIALNSWRTWSSGQVSWKGRNYSQQSLD